MNYNTEDYELEQRREEAAHNELKIQQEDEVLYGAHKIGSNIDAFLNRNPTAEFRDNE
jgi:hypothetical protein